MKKIVIDGKEYSNPGEIPANLQDLLKDENRNGLPHIVENALRTAKDAQGNFTATPTKFIVKGTSYNSLAEMPPEVRQQVEQKLQKANIPAIQMSAASNRETQKPSIQNNRGSGGPIPGLKKDRRNVVLILMILGVLGWFSYQYFITQ